jgi:hypothetical protein
MTPSETTQRASAVSLPATGLAHAVAVVGAAWTLSLGIDLFLHAGLLARLYTGASPFLLPAQTAFRRIPVGYISFLVLTAGLYWLFRRLGLRGAIVGLRYGASVGGVVWGAFTLGLYSISTADWPLLLGWWLGQAAELGVAGAVCGAANAGVPGKRLWLVALLAVFGLAASTIVLQMLGLAPAMEIVE